jgi:hypothetical protein
LGGLLSTRSTFIGISSSSTKRAPIR